MKKEKFFAISKEAIRNRPSVFRGDEFLGKCKKFINNNFSRKEQKRNRGFFLN